MGAPYTVYLRGGGPARAQRNAPAGVHPPKRGVFAASAAVGEVGLDGLAPGLGGGARIADRALQVTEDAAGVPRLGRVAEGLPALDHPPQLGAGLVVSLKLDERVRQVAARRCFAVFAKWRAVNGCPPRPTRPKSGGACADTDVSGKPDSARWT